MDGEYPAGLRKTRHQSSHGLRYKNNANFVIKGRLTALRGASNRTYSWLLTTFLSDAQSTSLAYWFALHENLI